MKHTCVTGLKKIAKLLSKGEVKKARDLALSLGLKPENFELLGNAIKSLKNSFPNKAESWYIRASIRVLLGVKKISYRHWQVKGLKMLGDAYPFYNVYLTKEGKYICDCYSRTYGYVRRAKICTHVAAVIIAKKLKNEQRINKYFDL